MLIRAGFVSNSSSTAFIVTNKTDQFKTLLDFAAETQYLVTKYNQEFDWNTGTVGEFLKCAHDRMKKDKRQETIWKPHEAKCTVFGDEDGDIIGRIYDYMLRDGGEIKSFMWRFEEWLR